MEEIDARSIAGILKEANIRQEYWGHKFEDIVFDDDAIERDIKTFFNNLEQAREAGMGMFLTGDFGHGKTMIISVILKRVLKLRMSAYFISAFDFFDCYGGFDAEHRQFRKFVRTVDFLAIDDVGSESIKARDYSFSLLDNLLVERQRPTLLSSNKNLKGLIRTYGTHLGEFIGTGRMREIFIDVGKSLRYRYDWYGQLEKDPEGLKATW